MYIFILYIIYIYVFVLLLSMPFFFGAMVLGVPLRQYLVSAVLGFGSMATNFQAGYLNSQMSSNRQSIYCNINMAYNIHMYI